MIEQEKQQDWIENQIPYINLNQVTKQYHNVCAVDDITLCQEQPSLIGLVGRNGSGKTTCMRLIAGQLEPTNGEVNTFGENPVDCLKVQNEVIYSYYNVTYDDFFRVKQIMVFYDNMYPQFDLDFAKRLLAFFQLKENQRYKSLSQGMKSTVNFICAIATRCPVTLLDEPTLGMDITVRKQVYQILLRDYMEHPRVIVISSHLLGELEELIGQIILIEEGKVLLNMDIEQMRQMAYRVDGAENRIKEALKANEISETEILNKNYKGVNSYVVVKAVLMEKHQSCYTSFDCKITRLKAETICELLTRQKGEEELDLLWNKES